MYYFLLCIGVERCQLITKIGTNRWPGVLRELLEPDGIHRIWQPLRSLQPFQPALSCLAWQDFSHVYSIVRMLTEPTDKNPVTNPHIVARMKL